MSFLFIGIISEQRNEWVRVTVSLRVIQSTESLNFLQFIRINWIERWLQRCCSSFHCSSSLVSLLPVLLVVVVDGYKLSPSQLSKWINDNIFSATHLRALWKLRIIYVHRKHSERLITCSIFSLIIYFVIVGEWMSEAIIPIRSVGSIRLFCYAAPLTRDKEKGREKSEREIAK